MALVDEDEWTRISSIPELLNIPLTGDSPCCQLIRDRSDRARATTAFRGVVVAACGVDRRRHAAVVDDAAAPATGSVDELRPPGASAIGCCCQWIRSVELDVAPVDRSVHRRHGVVLKEDVVTAVNPAQAIRIVQPALRRPNVQGGEAGISHKAKGYCPFIDTRQSLMLR